MAEKKLSAAFANCTCARIGYALFLCQEHAPIPYVLTDRGKREVRHMRQWDAIKDGLVESVAARRVLNRQALGAGRRIEARERRRKAS